MASELSVGVIVPVWNGERFLAEALDSVLAQGHAPVDVVVVDDGSTDGSAALAESYGAPVRVLRQANAGIGGARNSGFEAVAGELISFLDADDLFTEDSIARRVEVLAHEPDVDMVFGGVRRFSETDAGGTPIALNDSQPGYYPAAMLVRRVAYERVGRFPTHTHAAEGLDWMLRARELGLGERMLAEQVLWRRIHGHNISLRHRGEINEFAHLLKASLDRRRAAAAAREATGEES